MKATLLSLFFGLCLVISADAQFTTAAVDGRIGATEYGTNTGAGGQNCNSSLNGTGAGATRWYMTWDDTNLYVGLENANVSEAAVLYLDIDPSTANGNAAGKNYDGTDFASLPFAADFVVYFKSGYREYRVRGGSDEDGWTLPVSQTGTTYADNGGTTREIAIPWSVVPNGVRPASFKHFEYATTGGGFIYGQVPTSNSPNNGPPINNGALNWVNSFPVTSTTNGGSSSPYVVAGCLAPTAAHASVSGRITDSSGRGLSTAKVSVINQTGESRSVTTNPFGFYNLTELNAGETYVFDVRRKGYSFNTQVVSLTDNLTDLNFIGY